MDANEMNLDGAGLEDMGAGMPKDGELPGTGGGGYYDAPRAYESQLDAQLPTSFPNPYAPVRDFGIGGGNGFDLDAAMDKLGRKAPSFQAATAPVFFDWDKLQTDRYVNSDYYKEMGFLPGRDNETLYGERQTFGDVMQHAFAGGGKLAWNTFWDGWKGWGRMVNALFNWGSNESFKDRLMGSPEDLAELDKEQRDIFNKYAIFMTPESENSIFNRQFLGNLVQQGGFAVGALGQFAAEELISMGAASALKPLTGMRTLAQLMRAGITSEEVAKDAVRWGSTWKSMEYMNKMYQGLKTGAKAVGNLLPGVHDVFSLAGDISQARRVGATGKELAGVTFGALRRSFAEANMSFTESRMEAAGTYGDLRQKLYDKTLADKGTVSFEDEQRIDELSQKAAWDNFQVNALVISVMNRLQYDNIIDSFGSSKRILRHLADEGDNVLKVSGRAARDMTVAHEFGDIAIKEGERVTKAYDKSFFRNIKEVSADFGKRTAAWEATKSAGLNMMKWEVSEGLQELIQEGSNQAVQKYYTDLYTGGEGDWVKAMKAGAASQLNQQGLKTFLMGAVTGKLVSPISMGFEKIMELRQGKEQRQEIEKSRKEGIQLMNALFADPSRFAPEQVANIQVQNRAAQKMEEALTERDKYKYENAKDAAFIKAIMTAKKLGMMSALTDSFREYGKHFDDQQFFEAFGVDMTDENRGNARNYMNSIADRAVKISKEVDRLREKFSDIIRPELFEKGDQERVAVAKRAFDDVIEIAATNQARAGAAAERAAKIIEAAAKIPGVGDSAYMAFRILGNDENLDGEILLLQEELKNERESKKQSESGSGESKLLGEQLSRKEKELAALLTFKEHKDAVIRDEEKEQLNKEQGTIEQGTEARRELAKGAVANYIIAKNQEMGRRTELTGTDLENLFVSLRDMRSLEKAQRDFMDAYALIANPKKLLGAYIRLQEGLTYLQLWQKEKSGLSRAVPQVGTGPGAPPPDVMLNEDQVGKGTAIDEYHGFRAGDEVKDTVEGKAYQIKSLTTEGVTLVAKHSGQAVHRDLDWLDMKVRNQQLSLSSRTEGLRVALDPALTADKGKQGIFIITDHSKNITEYHLVDEEGKGVGEDGRLTTFRSLDLAEAERDRVIGERQKAGKDDRAPFTFDGKELKYKEILKDADGNRYQVLTKQQPEVENGKPEIRLKRLSDGTESRIEQLNGFSIAREGGAGQAAKTYKLSRPDVLNRVQGVPAGDETQEAADQRLEAFIHSVSDANLDEKLEIRATWNDNAVPQPAGAGTAAQNKYLLDNPDKVRIELLYDGKVIGSLPYFNRYQFQNEDGKVTDDLEKINAEQFKLLYDVGSGDAAELRKEFLRRYHKAEAVYNKIKQHRGRNNKPVTLKAAEVKKLFRIYRTDGELDEAPGPGTPLKDLIYPGVKGRGLVLAYRTQHEDTGNEVQKPIWFTEGDWTYDEKQEVQKTMDGQVKDKTSLTQQGPYVAVVELPNKTLQFVPLVTPAATTQELDALTKQVNQWSKEIKEERKKTADRNDKIHYNVNNQLGATVYVHVPGIQKGARVQMRLSGDGALVFSYIDDSLNNFVSLVVSGEKGAPLSFNSFADVLKAVEQKRKEHNAEADTPAREKIGFQLKEEHFRKHVEKDTPFSAIKEMPTGVLPGVVKDAYITVTQRSDTEQPFVVQRPGVRIGLFEAASGKLEAAREEEGAEAERVAKEVEERNKQLEEERKKQSESGKQPVEAKQVVAELKGVLGQTTTQLPDTSGGNASQTTATQPTTPTTPVTNQATPQNTGNVPSTPVTPQVEAPAKVVDAEREALVKELNEATAAFETRRDEVLAEVMSAAGGSAVSLDDALKKVNEDAGIQALKTKIEGLEQQAKKLNGPAGVRKMVTSDKLSEGEVEDIEKFEAFVNDNLPNFISVDTSHVIAEHMKEQGVTVGEFITNLEELNNGQTTVKGKIKVHPKSPFKYHEAFHAIFRLLLTEKQIKRLLRNGKTEKLQELAQRGMTLQQGIDEMVALDPVYYSKLTAAQLEERLYEEYLADQFDAWKMKPSIPTDPANKNFFRKLLDLIEQIINRFTRSEMDILFAKVNSKKFKGASVARNRFTTDINLQVGQPVSVLKSIEIGTEWIMGPDGEMIQKRLYLPEEKSTALATSIAATLHRRREKAAPEKTTEELLNEVFTDFAHLYNKNNPQYNDRREAIGPELDKLRRVFTFGREALREAVLQHLRLMNSAYRRQEEEEEENKEEEGSRSAYNKSKESIGGYGNLPLSLREYISTTIYEAEDAYHNKMLKEGEPLLQVVDANRVYAGILKILANERDVHKTLLRMQEFAEYNPESGHFIRRFFDDVGIEEITEKGYKRIEDQNSNLFNQVFSSFQQYTPNYLFFLKDRRGQVTQVVKANEREAVRNQFSIWYNTHSRVFGEAYAQAREEDKPALLERAASGFRTFAAQAADKTLTDDALKKAAMDISKTLKEHLGMDLHPLYLQYALLQHRSSAHIDTAYQKRLVKAFSGVYSLSKKEAVFLADSIVAGKNPFTSNGDIDLLQMKLEGSESMDKEEAALRAVLSNPSSGADQIALAKEQLSQLQELQSRISGTQTADTVFLMTRLAQSNALFDETVNTTSFRNAENELVYAHQLPTFHLVKVKELSDLLSKQSLAGVTAGKAELDALMSDPYMLTNLLLKSEHFRQMGGDLELARVEGMNTGEREDGKMRSNLGVTYGNFTEREMMLLAFELYGVTEEYKDANGKPFASARHLIRVLEASNTGDTVNLPVLHAVERKDGKVVLRKEARDLVVAEIRKEWERIKRVKSEREEIEKETTAIAEAKKRGEYLARTRDIIEGYHTAAKEGMQPRGETLFKTGVMLGALTKELEQAALLGTFEFDHFLEEIERRVDDYWTGSEGQLQKMVDHMKALEIIKEGKEKGALENVLLPKFMAAGHTKHQVAQTERNEMLNLVPGDLEHNLAQVLVNDFLNTQAFNQVLLGDQATSLESFVDMVKRGKGANMSGPSIASEATAPELGIHHTNLHSHVVQIKSPKVFGRYSGGKDRAKADSQMWLTEKSLRYILFGLGRLTEQRARFLDKIKKGESVEIQDVFGPGGSISFDGQTNSIKMGYYDGPRYIKTSGFLLTKGFTSFKNKKTGKWQARKTHRELDALRERLEKYENEHDTICMAVDMSASKCEKRNVARNVSDITDWNFQRFDNRYWRLQLENPSNKLKITDPTQVKQLVLTEQNDELRLVVPWNAQGQSIPTEMSVGELKRLYMQWTAQRSRVKYEQARNELFDMKEVQDELALSQELHKVTPKLAGFLRHAVEVLRSAGANSQALEFFSPDEHGGFKYNLNHPAVLDRFTNLFLSYFTKDVMYEKIPGHAATHASCYGVQVLKEVIALDADGQPEEWRVVRQVEYEDNPEEFDDALEWDADPTKDYGDNEDLKQQEIYTQRKFHALKERFDANQKLGKPTYILDDLRHNVAMYGKDANGNRIVKYRYAEALMAPHSAGAMELMKQKGALPDVLAEAFGTRIPTQDHGSKSNQRFVDGLPAYYGSTIINAPEVLETSDADFDLDEEWLHVKEGYARFDPATREWEFIEYGKVTDPKEQFEEYVRYQKQKNDLFKSRYKEMLANYRQAWNTERERLREEMKAFQEQYKERLSNKEQVDYFHAINSVNAFFDAIFQTTDAEEDSRADFDLLMEGLEQTASLDWKKTKLEERFKALARDFKASDKKVTEMTLKALLLPETVKAYMDKVAKDEEPNLGKLNNLILDAKMALHGNEHMTGGANPIAYRPTTPKILQELADELADEFPELRSIMQEGFLDPDTITGKVVGSSSNKEGSDNIGPAVNAMLVSGLANTFQVKLRKSMKRNGKEVELWRFKLDGHVFHSYEHRHSFNKETGEYDGERIFGVLSSIVSAMTDNAKERLAAKLGLNIDAVGLVSNLVAQGVPLRPAVLFMLQPVVRSYYQQTRNLKSPIKTETEERDNKDKRKIGKDLLAEWKEKMGDAQPVELTEALFRDNIHQGGTNAAYQFSVLDAFLKLQEQTRYFSYAASVMKLAKGMGATHEEGNTMEFKMNALQLFANDAEFEESAVPFDLRQVLTGANNKKPHNAIAANNIRQFRQIRELAKTLFLERCDLFQRQMRVIGGNLSIRGAEYPRFYKDLKWHWISNLGITAYHKRLKDSGRLVRSFSLTNALIYDAEALKMPAEFMDIVDAVRSIRTKLRDNYFVNKFLNVLPTTVTTKDGRVVTNPFNESSINKVMINTMARLDAQQVEKLQDSFLEIFQNKNLQMEAWTLFHYLLVKDGGQFRMGSFLNYVPTEMFEDQMAATKEVNELLMKDSDDAAYIRVLGMDKATAEGRFFKNYLLHVNNRKHVPQIQMFSATKDLPYKPAKAGLVDDYVPRNFTMGHENRSFVVNMKGGIRDVDSIDALSARRAEGYNEEKERARYKKNMTLLRMRGFRTVDKMTVEKGERKKTTKVQFPYVVRGYVNVDGVIQEQYYVLSVVDGVKVDGEKLPSILEEGEVSMVGEIARYELYGSPDGSADEWTGATSAFGKADTTKVLRDRGAIVNHRGFSIDDAPVAPPASLKKEGDTGGKVADISSPASIEPPADALRDFQNDHDVKMRFSPDKGLQFTRGGVPVPEGEQKALEEAYYERMGVRVRAKAKVWNEEDYEDYMKRMDVLVKFHREFKVSSSYDKERGVVSFSRKDAPVSEEEHKKLLAIYSERTGIAMERLTGERQAASGELQAASRKEDAASGEVDEEGSAVLPDDYELPEAGGVTVQEAEKARDMKVVEELKEGDALKGCE